MELNGPPGPPMHSQREVALRAAKGGEASLASIRLMNANSLNGLRRKSPPVYSASRPKAVRSSCRYGFRGLCVSPK
jgi:hypothetical protein